jgi:hypothetical protein
VNRPLHRFDVIAKYEEKKHTIDSPARGTRDGNNVIISAQSRARLLSGETGEIDPTMID